MVVALAVHGDRARTYPALARLAGLSTSEAFASVQRALASQLVVRPPTEDRQFPEPHVANVAEFVQHGVRFAFPAGTGGPSRGLPTAFAAPVFRSMLAPPSGEVPVWPDPAGSVRGVSFPPLYRSVVEVALRDPDMYDALAILDAIRGGSARERAIAGDLFMSQVLKRSPARRSG